MEDLGILTDEFAAVAASAGLSARERALAAGHSVVFKDPKGRYVEEKPNGRRYEVRFNPGAPRESHLTILRELEPAE